MPETVVHIIVKGAHGLDHGRLIDHFEAALNAAPASLVGELTSEDWMIVVSEHVDRFELEVLT